MTRLVPEIRFGGFDKIWEAIRIKELGDSVGGGTPSTKISEYWSGNIPWIQTSDLEEDNIFNIKSTKFINDDSIRNSAAKKITDIPAIAIVTRVGVGKLALMNTPFSTSQDFLSIYNLKEDSKFISLVIYNVMQKQKNILQGTSIKGVTKSELQNLKIYITNRTEQEKIGDFFEKLDNLLESQEKYVDLNKKLKKSLIQKVFPLNENKKSYIDLDGSVSIMKKIMLKNIQGIKIYQPDTITSKDMSDKYSYDVFGANGYIGKYHKYNHEKSQVTICCRGASCGNVNYVKPKTWITGNSFVVNLDNVNIINKDYFYYNLISKNLKRIITGSGQPQITRANLEKLSVDVISLAEQEKIGKLFKSLDEKIGQEERKLDALKAFKKAMLQKMFV